ncbi:HAD family hydrolase [Enterococcus hermanniensis]|uniref:HAD hydrolase, family IA n=1 Tax=Enterococcus hermanniensis TaxID=249189 RepID=A0A1L8TNU3_9ENTE|nr:HAD family hydrolase [Enterococcus hermanniensis]OJG45986.1 HAD hydrolase, family IA [Enterococcus hermanniensis]
MIKGIVFDLDDTLYEQQAPFFAAITTLFPKFPTKKLPSLFLQFRYYSDLHYLKTITGEWPLDKMRYERIRLALQAENFNAEDNDLLKFQALYDQALEKISLPKEIQQILNFLTAENISLGVITNGPVERQTNKMNALQLNNWFEPETLFISDGIQIQKPDPTIFKLMEKRLDLPAESLLYIGDSFENDVVGAKSANWNVWWFNHQHRPLPDDQTALFDLEITSFDALKQAIINEKRLQR